MLSEELKALVEQIQATNCETNTLEFKAAKGGFPCLYDTLSSFSNQDSGGVIILGYDEHTNSVCGVKDSVAFTKQIEEACAAMQPHIQVAVTCIRIDDKSVLSIEVPGLPVQQRPCYKFADGMLNGSYVRVGDADKKMPPAMLYSYVNYANRVYPDKLPVNEAQLSDLQTRTFQKYKVCVSEEKSNFANQTDSELLENSGLMYKGQPTLAGLMVLSDFPQKYFGNFYISAAVFDTNAQNARVLDGEHIDGNISVMLDASLRFVNRNMRHSIYFDNARRIDQKQYPDIALRELLLNALLHRDYGRYSEGRCINLMMYPDKIVITSPGLLYGNMTLDALDTAGYSREIRNPAITNAVEFLLGTENKGTGIRVARQAMQDMGLAEPSFEQDLKTGTFIVTLRSKLGRMSDTSPEQTNVFSE